MNKYFAQLRPLERRLAVGGLVVVIIVLNWVFVWPHFSDWGNLRRRLNDARSKLERYETVIAQLPVLEKEMKTFEGQGESVLPEDQAINFTRTIQSQSLQSRVSIINTSRQTTRTNDAFFVEQVQNINITATDGQLVDFLYKLGEGASMIRVPDLEVQPDAVHQHLSASIRLVASYQRNQTAPAATKSTPAATKSATPASKSTTVKAK